MNNLTSNQRAILRERANALGTAQPASADHRRVAAALADQVMRDCRICGYQWMGWTEEPPYCFMCIDTMAAADADVTRQHIEDAADRTNRSVATVRRHWKAMTETVSVAYRITWRWAGQTEKRSARYEVPPAVRLTGRWSAIKDYMIACVAEEFARPVEDIKFLGMVCAS